MQSSRFYELLKLCERSQKEDIHERRAQWVIAEVLLEILIELQDIKETVHADMMGVER